MNANKWAVETFDLTKVYGTQTVIKPLNIKIPYGKVFGLLGTNGAGKTTLMKIISGLSLPTSGTFTIYGKKAFPRTSEIKKIVGLIPQDNNLEREFTVEEALRIYARLFGVKNIASRVEEIIEQFSLEDMRKKIIRGLSGGMMRRVLIARALLPKPELLLLDEPTVGLDPDVRHSIWDIIDKLRAEGKTIIFTTHYMEEAEKLCDHIAIFKKGELVLSVTKEALQEKIGHDVKDLENLFLHLARGGK